MNIIGKSWSALPSVCTKTPENSFLPLAFTAGFLFWITWNTSEKTSIPSLLVSRWSSPSRQPRKSTPKLFSVVWNSTRTVLMPSRFRPLLTLFPWCSIIEMQPTTVSGASNSFTLENKKISIIPWPCTVAKFSQNPSTVAALTGSYLTLNVFVLIKRKLS